MHLELCLLHMADAQEKLLISITLFFLALFKKNLTEDSLVYSVYCVGFCQTSTSIVLNRK